MARTLRTIVPITAALLAALVLSGTAMAATLDLPDGSKLDLSAACPICNMKLEGSTLGPAAVVFKDGKVIGFDGTGDMFRYVLDPAKHGFDPANIKLLFVTEHGTKNFVDAKAALYVVGSDVAGDMGPEVVPFAKKEEAEKFLADHHGKTIATYVQITTDDLKSKKKMLKMKQDDMGGGMKH